MHLRISSSKGLFDFWLMHRGRRPDEWIPVRSTRTNLDGCLLQLKVFSTASTNMRHALPRRVVTEMGRGFPNWTMSHIGNYWGISRSKLSPPLRIGNGTSFSRMETKRSSIISGRVVGRQCHWTTPKFFCHIFKLSYVSHPCYCTVLYTCTCTNTCTDLILSFCASFFHLLEYSTIHVLEYSTIHLLEYTTIHLLEYFTF